MWADLRPPPLEALMNGDESSRVDTDRPTAESLLLFSAAPSYHTSWSLGGVRLYGYYRRQR
jgi:hypothetical protein